MPLPKLTKKQHIHLPTPLGLMLITLIFLTTTIFILKNLANYLAEQQPLNKGILVVEGWLSEQALLTAVEQYQSNPYQQLITTGGLIKGRQNTAYKTYAESAATFLQNNGINKNNITALVTPESAQNRTFLSAVIVRDWLINKKHRTTEIDVFSGAVHARRTRDLYQMAFPDQYKIGIIAAKPREYTLKQWWQSSAGAKTVITEFVGLIWVKCCFYQGEYQSHQERWGGSGCLRMLDHPVALNIFQICIRTL